MCTLNTSAMINSGAVTWLIDSDDMSQCLYRRKTDAKPRIQVK